MILDASERVGDPWRRRWDSLRLYSPASHDGLPGMRFPAKRTSYPTTHEMADYLESYAAHFELPVRSGDGRRCADEGRRRVRPARPATTSFEADNVVVATGVMQVPHVPSFAPELDAGITQLHSSDYRNLSQLQEGPVLVVGASHSGSDVAYEAAAAHRTILSGVDTGQIPARVDTRRGRMGFRVLFFLGSHVFTMDTPIGRKMREHIRHGGAPLLRHRRKDLRAAGVERTLARAVGVQDGMPVLDDGTRRRRPQRRLVHGVQARLLVDRRPVRKRGRRLPRAVPGRRRLGARALLRRAAVPALLHLDAHRRDGQGRRAGRQAHRGAAGQSARVGQVGPDPPAGRVMSDVPDTRSRHERSPPSSAVLVWNGMVTRIRPIGVERPEGDTPIPTARGADDAPGCSGAPSVSRGAGGVRVP